MIEKKIGGGGPEITQVGASERVRVSQDPKSNWVPLRPDYPGCP